MAVPGDVTVAHDGGQGNVKLHPYFIALVRWCVSCLWSTATVVLHRLVATPLPQITAAPKAATKPRPAGKEHLDPEPKVECVVLHQPPTHTLDVIFVHGLYGSLANTWRQGEWRSKYKLGPNRIPLRRPASIPTICNCNERRDDNSYHSDVNEKENAVYYEENDFQPNDDDSEFYNDLTEVIGDNNVFITENFYKSTMLNHVEIIDNYETQGQFVRDLFEYENKRKCDNLNDNNRLKNYMINGCLCQNNIYNHKNDSCNHQNDNHNSDKHNNGNSQNDNCYSQKDHCDCSNDRNTCDSVDKACEEGCGCICDRCYSHCWPKDWIKVDFPNARVISINYTSDPHLWRPLWVKECKRLRLHERAEQMTQQLLDLDVGSRPIVWVGHSKGGLFIKQIYCEAYEAHLRVKKHDATEYSDDRKEIEPEISNVATKQADEKYNKVDETQTQVVNVEETQITEDGLVSDDNKNNVSKLDVEPCEESSMSIEVPEDLTKSKTRAGLWSNSAGFMFYSVPHRGSPLADIKTPITARSIELMEICKDGSLVVSLQARWLRATEPSRPRVRSLVETSRTLMSVLWLRIVSVDSADAGIGALCGVSVDHREICKPSSRRCLLYTELTNLIHAALKKCKCQ